MTGTKPQSSKVGTTCININLISENNGTEVYIIASREKIRNVVEIKFKRKFKHKQRFGYIARFNKDSIPILYNQPLII